MTISSFVRVEGAVAIVLKPLDAALAERDHIYAVVSTNSPLHPRPTSLSPPWQILGTAINNNRSDVTLSKPSEELQQRCIRDAFLDAVAKLIMWNFMQLVYHS